MTKVGGIRKIMVLWQAVFLAASPLVTAPPSNLTRLYYNGSAAKSHSTTTQYRQLRRLRLLGLLLGTGKTNRPLPSSPRPLYQNVVKCSTFDMEMIFHSHANKNHFHKKGCALGLILKVKVFGTRKWPIGQ